MEVVDFVDKLGMQAHPEGGYFAEIYRSSLTIGPKIAETEYPGERNLATSIYYILANNQVSKLHQLKSDELWYYHYGSTLLVHVFFENKYTPYVLGIDVNENQRPQIIIPAGAIFGAEVIDKASFTLVGCVVTPGFHFSDFRLVSRDEMLALYPDHNNIIHKLI
ncbi:MAG TPA: cupin domain-containing protein [Bacteroidales bacterium]|nr:cupin domain-containing protein [Bacteroidales bacterium]